MCLAAMTQPHPMSTRLPLAVLCRYPLSCGRPGVRLVLIRLWLVSKDPKGTNPIGLEPSLEHLSCDPHLKGSPASPDILVWVFVLFVPLRTESHIAQAGLKLM